MGDCDMEYFDPYKKCKMCKVSEEDAQESFNGDGYCSYCTEELKQEGKKNKKIGQPPKGTLFVKPDGIFRLEKVGLKMIKDNIQILVIISGELKNYFIDFFSNPPMARQDIINLLKAEEGKDV